MAHGGGRCDRRWAEHRADQSGSCFNDRDHGPRPRGFRAVAPLPKLLAISWHLVKAEGALLAIKGEGAQAEIDSTEPKKHSITRLHTIELPGFDISRVIEVRKTA